jgi:hypothetical protein
MTKEELEERQIVEIDILNDEIPEKQYIEEEDPKKIKFKNESVPVLQNWKEIKKVVTLYKKVEISVPIWGIQTKVESWIKEVQVDFMRRRHRLIYCWADLWYLKGMDELREYEDEVRKKLIEINGE